MIIELLSKKRHLWIWKRNREKVIHFSLVLLLLIPICNPLNTVAQNFEAIFKKAADLPEKEREAFIQQEIQKQVEEEQKQERLKNFTAQVEKEYTPMFQKMGISKEKIISLKSARVELLRLAIEDGDPRQKFFEKRNGYDKEVSNSIHKEFLSQLDHHPLTKRTLHTVDETLWSTGRNQEYQSLYSQWGMDESDIQTFQSQRSTLYKMATALKGPRQELINARARYLENIKNEVEPTVFEQYRIWELTKQARITFEEFKNRTTHIELDLLAQYETTMVDLIRESKLILSETWHNPFGSLPRPVSGRKLGAILAQNLILELKETKNTFLAAVQFQKLPEPIMLELNAFFLERWNQLNDRINMGNETEAEQKERLRELTQAIDRQIRRNPKALPKPNQFE